MKFYGIYDTAIQAFAQPPFVQPTDASAIRAIKNEANREGSQLNQNSDDFELYELGTWHDDTGQIEPNKKLVCRVKDLKALTE